MVNFLNGGGPALIAALISFVVSGWIVKWGQRLGIVDDPKSHHHPKVVHDKPVPRGGGIPIAAAVITAMLVTWPKENWMWGLGVIGGVLILAVTGSVDDKYEEKVSPYVRLALNGLAALCVIGVGVGIAYITNPWGGVIRLDGWQYCFTAFGGRHCIWILADLFALLWLIWMQNIVGWSSGVDGQLPGFVITAAITIALLGIRTGDANQWPVIILAAITAGAYAGFLPWNWWPQKMMPGYGGKSLAGFLLGTLAIMSSAKVGAILLVLGVPMIDAVLVIIKRIREGRSPVWGGREHLHHLLMDAGWSKRKIAVFYWGISILLAGLAWQLKAPAKFYTMAAAGLVIAGAIIWLQNWSTYSKQQGPDNG
jgi:UDP-GlcNAc:undecaprenyl-phosphate/decaprenyl-phosphate GlcNAc-1-phosphate transferase